jgi:pimeloyl-ACP methyl ester carboxylesterase
MERHSGSKRPFLRRVLIGCGVTTVALVALLGFLALAISPGATDFESPHHPYRSEEAKQEFLASYDARASKWPVPSTTTAVPTTYGPTFVRMSGPETGPPLVLLHGAGGSSLHWLPNVAALSEHYRTYAVDIVGDYGRSVHTRDLQSAEDYATWLDELLDALDLKHDVNLVGLSYGGWISAHYALHAPERLRKVVLLAPAGTVAPLPFSWIWRAILVALPNPYFTKRFLYWVLEDLSRTEDGRVVLDDAADAGYHAMRARTPRQMAPPDVLPNEALRSFAMPVLFVVGENEKLYPATDTVARLNEVAPNIETQFVPSAGHDLTMVRADRVNRIILEFLAEPPAP